MLDLIVKNGEIIDGSGKESYIADIAVYNEKIVMIGCNIEAESRETINAEGYQVCPGFIDIHSHSDFTLFQNPKGESKIRQGITTEIVGNCGFTAAPVNSRYKHELVQYLANTVLIKDELKKNWNCSSQNEYIREACENGTSVNIGSLVGHGTLRIAAMGMAKRDPAAEERKNLRKMLIGELENGLFGMSSGLQYEPGSFASINEIIELCKIVKEYGGVYTVHLKSEGKYLLECIKESLKAAEESGVSLEISHLKAEGPRNWGKVEKALELIDGAYEKGINVGFDVYPYTAFGSGLIDLVPPWARESGIDVFLSMLCNESYKKQIIDDMMNNFSDWENPLHEIKGNKIRIASLSSEKNRKYEGMSIEEISEYMNCTPYEAVLNLLMEEKGAVKSIFHAMCEEDLIRTLKHPRAIFCTDGRATAPYGELGRGKIHPRYYGSYPRILGKYVRELKIIDIGDAIKKMTHLPALKMNIKGRGLLKKGYYADIVIFDKNRIIDVATFDDPHRYPDGIVYVIVNGRVSISKGEHTGVFSGRVLKRQIC